MPYRISQIQFHRISDNYKYLLDSNIWIEILTSRNAKSPRHKRYLTFFSQLTSNPNVKIVLPALLVSEVLNRILREVYMSKYAIKNGLNRSQITSEYYKTVYRSTQDFKDSYNSLCDDISNYSASLELISDGFGADVSFDDIMSNPPVGLDFNDYFYFNLAKKNNYFIVTDDKDFFVEGIQIITESPSLIERKNLALVKVV